MWKYKSGEFVKMGDHVRISRKWAIEHGCTDGIVVGLAGFITVELLNGAKIDFDMRSLTFVRRKPEEHCHE